MNNPNQHISPQVQGTTLRDIHYTFSGKERDQETGYVPKTFGIGARYYSSVPKAFGMSVWLSRKLSGADPLLVGKYPEMSPYMYVAGNPINYEDVY
jgi:RHS repeat-associated protein